MAASTTATHPPRPGGPARRHRPPSRPRATCTPAPVATCDGSGARLIHRVIRGRFERARGGLYNRGKRREPEGLLLDGVVLRGAGPLAAPGDALQSLHQFRRESAERADL